MNDPHDNAQADREALERYRETLTHATTVPQPLAWACAAGHCPVIMSDTRPGMEHEGKLIGIHAGIFGGPLDLPIPAADDGCGIGGCPGPEIPHNHGPDRTPDGHLAERRGHIDPAGSYRLDLPQGALIGVARLVGVVQAKVGDPIRFWHVSGRSTCVGTYASEDVAARIRPWWRSGSKWGLLLTDAVLFPEPIPMRGAGGVWRLPRWTYPTWGEVRDAGGWALEQWREARGA